MAVYRNRNDDTIIRGSEFKLNIRMNVIDEQHMEDVEFFCTFKAGGKGVNVQKRDMIKVSADNGLATLDFTDLGKRAITIRYKTDMPDEVFADGYRHEIIDISTKIKIV